VLVLWRFVYTEGKTIDKIQSNSTAPWLTRIFTLPWVKRRLNSDAIGQGIGRHTKEEVYEMGLKDLRALFAYLGSKPYFTGQQVTELDCAAFGSLAQFL